MTDAIDTVLTDLQRQRDQLAPDAAESDARRIANETATKASALENRINTIRSATFTLKQLDAQIASELRWREDLAVVRAQLCKELLGLPPRIRDGKTLGVQQNLTLSIKSLDFGLQVDRFQLNTLRLGDFLKEAGYFEGPKIENQTYGELPWHGSLKEIEQRLKRLGQERDEAQHRLDDAMMSEADRAKQIADVQAKNAAGQLKVRGDGSRYRKFSDGTIQEIEGD